MSLLKDLSELESAHVISSETSRQITDYYRNKQLRSPNRQLLILGILGALLIGIGAMFIIANQWDDLPKKVQTTMAFLLLIIPQSLGAFVIIRKEDKIVWKEIAALLLFFAVGSSISLISQIYQISGETSSYLLTWMMLSFLLIYIFDSSAVSIACLIGIMSYGLTISVDSPGESGELLYWLFLAIPIPHYLLLTRKAPNNILLILHHWVIPSILTVTLFTLLNSAKPLTSMAYISMFALFYLIGYHPYFRQKPIIHNGYKAFGLAGTVVTLLVMSFQPAWKSVYLNHYSVGQLISNRGFIASLLLFLLASFALYLLKKDRTLKYMKLPEFTFLVFLLIFILGNFSGMAYILVNLLVLALAILMIKEGSKQLNMSILNSGLIVIALLAVCRSFDADIEFAVKGSIFVVVGIGFFVANWLMLKKKKENES